MDTKIGQLSCASLLAFSVKEKDQARVQELLVQARQLAKDAKEMDPDNPRLLWVLGPNLWYIPPERGGGEDKAMAIYEKGLATIRSRKSQSDPLAPSWGEPGLLMDLAWSNLNRKTPDLKAAENYANSASVIVPDWH